MVNKNSRLKTESMIEKNIARKTSEQNPILSGPVVKTMTTLSLPIIFAMLLQIVYNLTDTFWVGRLGANAIASISLSWPALFLITSFGGGLAMAGTILVSQHKGKGDNQKVDFISSQTISIMFILSIFLGIIGYFTASFLINLMGASPEVVPDTIRYLQVSFMGLVFSYVYYNFQSLMRGVGEVKIPMYIVIGTVILNFIIDPIFILGWGIVPKLGVVGAAWTTIISQAISAMIGITILVRGKRGIKMHLRDIAPRFSIFKKILKLGFPSAIGQSMTSINMLIITFLVAGFGTVSIAAFGLGIRVLSLVIVPAVGFSMAIATMIGQNMGAKKIDRAESISNKGMLISFISLTLLGGITFLFAKIIVGVFIPGEIEVINESAYFIRAMALTFGFIGLRMTTTGIFNGSGNTKSTMVVSILSLVFLFGFALILSRFTNLGVDGVWLAYPISNVLSGTISWIWVLGGNWKHKRVV